MRSAQPRVIERVLLVAALCIPAGFIAGCVQGCGQADPKPAVGKQGQAASGKKYSRDEFKRLVVGKTTDEVIKLIGRPQRTADLGQFEAWSYPGLTTDPISGRDDESTSLNVTKGRVSSVDFF